MNDKKISLAEVILLVLIVVPLDAIELVAGIIPGASYIFIGYDLAVMGGLFLYFYMKGGSYALPTAGNGIETLFAGLDVLPIRTVTLIIAIYQTNRSGTKKPAQAGLIKRVVRAMLRS